MPLTHGSVQRVVTKTGRSHKFCPSRASSRSNACNALARPVVGLMPLLVEKKPASPGNTCADSY
jgi:hypothetical protein